MHRASSHRSSLNIHGVPKLSGLRYDLAPFSIKAFQLANARLKALR